MSTVTLSGVPQPFRIEAGTLTIHENTRGKPNTADFTILPRSGFDAPSHSQAIEIVSQSVTIFSGLIQSVDQKRTGIAGGGIAYSWTCSAVDWEILLHKHLHTKRYVNQTMGAIIRQICADSAPGIDFSQVPDGPVIDAVTINFELPADAIKRLTEWAGYIYWVDYSKVLQVSAKVSLSANLKIGPSNSTGLEVIVDRSQLRNKVIVRGGSQASEPVTETFTGDGSTGNFLIHYKPYSPNPPAWINDSYNAPFFNDGTWLEFDVSNPTPIAPHVSADGYIYPYPSDQANKYSSLQVVGGPGSYGSVGLISKMLYTREEQRQIRQAFISDTAGDMVMGWCDGTGVSLASVKHGIRLKGGGVISRMESGVETILAQTYVSDATTEYQFRVVLKKAGGANYYIQGGAYGTFGGPDWTLMSSTSADVTVNLSPFAVMVSSGVAAIFSTIVEDQAYSVSLTVNGVAKTVGYDNVDNEAGVWALINQDTQQLRFFGSIPGPSTIPAPGDVIVLTYTYAIPVLIAASDPVSITKIGLLEGSDGIYEGLIKDPTIMDYKSAQLRAQAELDQFSNPEVAVTWAMPHGAFTIANRPQGGQVIEIISGAASGNYLIQDVSLHEVIIDQFEIAQARAGSRLRGLEDYLQALIAAGKQFPQDPLAKIDYLLSPDDNMRLSDTLRLIGSDDADIIPRDTFRFTDTLAMTVGADFPPYEYDVSRYEHAQYS